MRRRNLTSLASAFSLASLVSLVPAAGQDAASDASQTAIATQPIVAQSTVRTWVDITGKFAIEASLVEWTDKEVRLVKLDGKRVAIDYAQLSELDRKFLESTVFVAQIENDLAMNSTTSREPVSVQSTREPLALPSATSVAPDSDALQQKEPLPSEASWPKLPSLAIDPPTSLVSIPTCVVSIDNADGWASCSRPLLVESEATPQVAISVTRGVAFPSGGSHNQIMFIDPATSELKTVWEGDKRVTLLDHHQPSGLSLVLNDHNSVGEGGLLELLKLDHASLSADTKAAANPLRSFVRRALPANGKTRSASKVTWARMLDSEHIVAVIDTSLGCWNLVSGECLYVVGKLDPRIEPVLSPGRRYMAVPDSGEMLLYSAENGQPLGRIELDRNLTPNIAFSPSGEFIGIVSGKRLRVHDLAQGKVVTEFSNVRTLGTSSPVWINDDLVLSSNGIVLSRSRQTAVWQYDIVGDTITRVADRVALLKKYQGAELAILELPHPAADATIASLGTTSIQDSSPAKSKWKNGSWIE